MKKVKDIINLIKTNNYIRIAIELILGIGLFNVNNVFSVIFMFVISLEVVFANIEDTLLIYIFLSFFDEVLIFEMLKGSISRLLMIIIIIKLGIFIIKNKIKPNKYHIGISIFFIISLVVGIITYKTISSEVAITMANIFVILMFSMCINIKDDEEINKFIKKILCTIVFAILGSILYGVCTNNFLVEYEGTKISYRFKGTNEPNFMSMYISLGIIALLFLKDDIKYKWFVILSFAIMFNAIIATVSMTGLIAVGIILLLYAIMQRKRIRYEIKDWIIIALITILMFGVIRIIPNIKFQNNIDNSKTENNIIIEINNENRGNEENSDGGIINRLRFLKQKVMEGDWDRISSGRLSIIKNFISKAFDRPLGNILFGDDMTAKEIYTKHFDKEMCSHCTYIDFMYNFGIVGLFVVSGYLFIITKRNIFLNQNIANSKYKNAIKLIRILLLIYSISLSLYIRKVILIFFLI